MRKILMLTCGILMVSSVVFAEDTVETCANGAGFVLIGAVTGHKYCSSYNTMNWWNAWAWCDAMGMRMFDLKDCACGTTTSDCANNKCPEMTNIGESQWNWIAKSKNASQAYGVNPSHGQTYHSWNRDNSAYGSFHALCY
ncbi:MAG: hypothetical protein J6V11_01940 [Alphaproteobacteria bacterium]|nr:hypothetical protein [Alphaproteobacteria bacterium]